MEKKYKKKKLGSYPFLSVTFSTTLALFVIGLFGLLLLYTSRLKEIIQENVEVQVYLHKQISDNDKIRLQKALSDKQYVLKIGEVPQIRFISKDEAAKQFVEDTGEDFLQFLGDNPLRDLFVVQIHADFHASNQLSEIKSEIEALTGVYNVVYAESVIESINQNMAKISLVLLFFAGILLFTVVMLINNTIKLALFSQRFLIRSMQLVGATSSFIKRPFLYRASFYGFLAGVMAIVLIYVVLTAANANIEDLNKLQNEQNMLVLMAGIIVLGIMVGLISTHSAINKYLNMSLDELY